MVWCVFVYLFCFFLLFLFLYSSLYSMHIIQRWVVRIRAPDTIKQIVKLHNNWRASFTMCYTFGMHKHMVSCIVTNRFFIQFYDRVSVCMCDVCVAHATHRANERFNQPFNDLCVSVAQAYSIEILWFRSFQFNETNDSRGKCCCQLQRLHTQQLHVKQREKQNTVESNKICEIGFYHIWVCMRIAVHTTWKLKLYVES